MTILIKINENVQCFATTLLNETKNGFEWMIGTREREREFVCNLHVNDIERIPLILHFNLQH